ncbi:Gfo/Idh/MocA family protein [Periweissella ghanensis]|uniref:Scyllo-inositol 2-dehydrogenase (NADP(+)) IolU n=1 Tax=Periweissella ghanensis TaxID=467997 RepID=A0ABM8ZD23_9LACO|nr:Gfo/Idh/MocA family oxidoreductase [Periweissella ghanensis]MCM0600795.1 Gfo/Idh/MocA family oxidoreductase [Periweissella ghanensis]CAH0418563.1 scyllo-inositol 2-dehydrogenase (NADP(+)) IolU [Periweissella ghanensis]
MVLKVGTIGTSWITEQFIEAFLANSAYDLGAIYTRDARKAAVINEKFATKAPAFTDLDAFFASDIDVVYIASPNALHYRQILQAIENDKHVIVEKPAVITPTQFEMVYSKLREHPNVRFFEAARHIHQPNFKKIAEQINKMEKIQGATFVYNKYSSRFDDFLAGKNPNVFNPEFAGGAIEDLGVYPIYAALALFGLPQDSQYFATKLANGADGRGTAILRYAYFDVTLIFGKNSNSYLASEIYGLEDSIVIDSIAELTSVLYHRNPTEAEQIADLPHENPMSAEVTVFAEIINNFTEHQQEYQDLLMLSQRVNNTIYHLRQTAALSFPADLEK